VTDSIKRYIPGTNPLDERRYRLSDAERDDLIARVRGGMAEAHARSGHAKRGTTIALKRLAELRAERAAERERARAAARELRVAEGVVVVPAARRRPAKARRTPVVDPPIPFWLLPTGPVRK
jgi:hypothetical protein